MAASILQIEENIGSVFPARSKALVTRFDDAAFDFDLLLGGRVKIGHLLHRYEQVEGGSSFYTEMLLGAAFPVAARFFTEKVAADKVSEDFVRAWVLYNIEESGETRSSSLGCSNTHAALPPRRRPGSAAQMLQVGLGGPVVSGASPDARNRVAAGTYARSVRVSRNPKS